MTLCDLTQLKYNPSHVEVVLSQADFSPAGSWLLGIHFQSITHRLICWQNLQRGVVLSCDRSHCCLSRATADHNCDQIVFGSSTAHRSGRGSILDRHLWTHP